MDRTRTSCVVALLVCLCCLCRWAQADAASAPATGAAADAMKKGDEFMAAKQFREAAEAYQQAAQAAPSADALFKAALAELSLLQSSDVTPTERAAMSKAMLGQLRQATQIDPNHVPSQAMLCTILWQVAGQTGNWGPYLAEADKLLRLTPNNHQVVFLRAMAEARLGLRDPNAQAEALAGFRRAVELEPNDTTYRLQLMGYLLQTQKPDEAKAVVDEGIARDPNGGELRLAWADWLLSQGQPADAAGLVRQAIERQPQAIAGYLSLARCQIAQKDPNAAIATLQQAIAIDDCDARSYRELAAVFARMGKGDEARDCIRKGMKNIEDRIDQNKPLPPEEQRLQLARCQLAFVLASTLLDRIDQQKTDPTTQRAVDESRDCLELITRFAPNSPQRAKIAGLLALAQGKSQEALNLLTEAAMGLRASDHQNLQALVTTALAVGEPGRAIDLLLKLRQHGMPLDQAVTIETLLGTLYYETKDFAKAEETYLRLLKFVPRSVFILNNLAYMYAVDLKTPEKALPYAKQAAELAPKEPNILDTYGWTLALLGQYDEAETVLSQAAALAPNNATCAKHLEETRRLKKEKPTTATAPTTDRVIIGK